MIQIKPAARAPGSAPAGLICVKAAPARILAGMGGGVKRYSMHGRDFRGGS